ncbi:MAG: DNA polymerase III subunit delta [Micrococcaceae bacterium]
MQHQYLIQGSEDFLVMKAKREIKDKVLAEFPEIEAHEVDASEYQAGELNLVVAPSLFAAEKLVFFDKLEKMSADFMEDILEFIASKNPDIYAVYHHAGGQKGRKVLTQLKKSAEVIDAKPLTKETERIAFVRNLFKEKNRIIEPMAVRTLITSIGQNVSELGNAAKQLMDDTKGTVTEEIVDKYYGDRVEVTVFKVVDAIIAGNMGQALAGLRYALATGVEPVPFVAATASKFRTMAKISDMSEPPGALAKKFGMAPWQAQQAKRDLRGWTPESLTNAIQAVAQADYDVKGGSRAPVYVLEKMVRTVCEEANKG